MTPHRDVTEIEKNYIKVPESPQKQFCDACEAELIRLCSQAGMDLLLHEGLIGPSRQVTTATRGTMDGSDGLAGLTKHVQPEVVGHAAADQLCSLIDRLSAKSPRYVVGFDVRVAGCCLDATAHYLTDDDVQLIVRKFGWGYSKGVMA